MAMLLGGGLVSAQAPLGQSAPACELSLLDSSRAPAWDSYLGQVLYVDFWASWCGPCLQSFPFMDELQSRHGTAGLRVVAVNLDERPEDARLFLEDMAVSFQVVEDASETKQCARDFGVAAMPSSYLIDRKGVVRHVHRGFRPGDTATVRALVEFLLQESGE